MCVCACVHACDFVGSNLLNVNLSGSKATKLPSAHGSYFGAWAAPRQVRVGEFFSFVGSLP